MMNEALKQQEVDMKANCKRQKADLEALLARLKDCPLPPDEMQRMLQIEQVYEQELSRLKQLKQLLSKKAQEIQLLRRKIDDVPTRTELVQCVSRSVAGTTDETKKYFTTYNTLQNTKEFILKESKVMDRQDPVSALALFRHCLRPPNLPWHCFAIVLSVLTLQAAFATSSPKILTRGSSWRVWRAF